MNALISFQFKNSSIRIQKDSDDHPWFNAQDICTALEFGNPRQALDSHVDEDDVQKLDVIDELGRTQKANYINESGLYALIFGSTKEAAKTFKKWVTSEVLPAIRKTGHYQRKQVKPLSPIKQAKEAVSYFAHYARAMQRVGFDKNAALISANQATRTVADTDILALGGNTHLVAENQASAYYTPTELGKRLNISAQKVNKLLETAQLQTGVSGKWEPTSAGQAHCRRFDVGKAHSNGTPIQQIKWADSVLPVLQADQTQQAA